MTPLTHPLIRAMVAGGIGTAAMTLSERLEMTLSGRSASQVPGQVGAAVLPGRDPQSAADVEQLNTAVHWAHGISVGALRAGLSLVHLRGPVASIAHFALVWSGDAALYRILGIADVPWKWNSRELATDLLHKGIYAAVTGVAYDILARRRSAA